MKSLNRWLFLICLVGLLLTSPILTPALAQAAQAAQPVCVVLQVEGPLTPVMAEYIQRGLTIAQNEQATAVILQINTPGGSIDIMNRIVEAIRASQVPVVTYVAPNGAMAGSAGTLITLAGHLIAMAPQTTIGAASPVGSGGQDIGATEAAKVKNILEATARSLTEHRKPQAVQLATDTIENARAASASEALNVGLADIIASDQQDLLYQMDGKSVSINGENPVLHTQNAQLVEVPPTLIENVLNLLTNPDLVLVLLNIGVLALLIELSSPGGWVAGFIGVVCLALAIYGLGYLPVNWFGIIFIVLAFVLFIVDIKAPTHGALTVAGVLSFIVGALVLFNSPGVPSFQRVSVPLVIGSGIFTAGIFFTMLSIGLRAQARPVLTGWEKLVGTTGMARTPINPHGMVNVGGEQWSADLIEGTEPISAGTRVEVVEIRGLRLKVRKAEGL